MNRSAVKVWPSLTATHPRITLSRLLCRAGFTGQVLVLRPGSTRSSWRP
jgi:hypothetical protein